MYCSKCGTKIADGITICSHCGAILNTPRTPPPPAPPPQESGYPPPPDTSGVPAGNCGFQPQPGKLFIEAGRPLEFPFKDPSWLSKCLLIGVVSLIPVLHFSVLGYFIEVANNVRRGNSDVPLPDLKIGQHFSAGFPYALMIVLYFLATGFLSNLFFGASIHNPASIEDLSSLLGKGMFAASLMMVLNFIVIAYFYLALPVAILENKPFAILNPVKCFKYIKTSLGQAFLVFVLAMILPTLYTTVGVLCCCVGLLVTIPLNCLATAHLTGQLCAIYETKLAQQPK